MIRNLFLLTAHYNHVQIFAAHLSTKAQKIYTSNHCNYSSMGSAVQWDAWVCRSELNRCMLGSIFEMATRSSRSISFKHDRLSFLINTNVEKLCSHKYVVQNWRRISGAFSEICLYSFPTTIQNSSRVISRNFNRSVLSFRSSRKFSLIGNDNFCDEISASTEKGFRIQSYCYELIAKK